jgi:hypothetical protein
MTTFGEVIKGKEQQVELTFDERSLLMQLIKERRHPLDLLRELISNAGAKEVGAKEIRIKYTVDEDGHVFEVHDNGCGMLYSGNKAMPQRLDKFLGLGLSAIVGVKGDEFSWKGLGSKLAFQSKRIELETWTGEGDAIRVDINEPWKTIEAGQLPRPRLFRHEPEPGRVRGTTIRVIGHPPHRQEDNFTADGIINFLSHRTFVGSTRHRDAPPDIHLSVLGKPHSLFLGFPEFRQLQAKEGTLLIDETEEITKSGTNLTLRIRLRGFITWDAADHHLSETQYNTGLALAVKGIPYFELDMEEHGSRSIAVANPGRKNCCLVLECDDIQDEMNISRSGLVDSDKTLLLRSAATTVFARIEKSPAYLEFRQIPQKRKTVAGAGWISKVKTQLEADNQRWVVYRRSPTDKPIQLLREPENENDLLAILWKLEALGGLPFAKFQTLAHAGTGPDLIVHFQEDDQSHLERYTSIEVESRFRNYKAHGHKPSQYPRVVCWELGTGKKITVNATDKKYKFVAPKDDYLVQIFCIRHLDGISVVDKREIDKLFK